MLNKNKKQKPDHPEQQKGSHPVFTLFTSYRQSSKWLEANQLAIYKRGRGFELGTTKNKSSKWSERDLDSGPPNCKTSALTARPSLFWAFI